MARVRTLSFRVIAIVVALILAAVATLAILSYMDSVEAERAAQIEPVEVFVAIQRIPEGTPVEQAVSQGLVERRELPRNAVAPGAVDSLEPLAGRVASAEILPGEQILTGRFIAPQAIRGLAPIPDDMQAISVEVGIPPGVAGFIQQGDRVSVIARLDTADPEEQADQVEDQAPGTEPVEQVRVQFLLQGVEVLSVGQRVIVQQEDGSEASSVSRGEGRVLLTLALSPVDAEKLAYAIFEGDLYFTLLPEDQETPFETPGRTRQNAFE